MEIRVRGFEPQARGLATLDLVDERQQVEFEVVQCMVGYGRMSGAQGSYIQE